MYLQLIPPEQHQALFYHLAKEAKARRILTDADIRLLSRVGTRKAPYWSRHLYDLVEVLRWKGQIQIAIDAGIPAGEEWCPTSQS